MKRLTTVEFIAKAKLIHGSKYDYSTCEYISNKQPITIYCPHHGNFVTKPNTHLNGTGCRVCGRLSAKLTCLERYGVENPSQLPIFVDKKKATLLGHYGVEYPYQSKDIWYKRGETCFNNYGVVHSLQNMDIRQRIKQTNLKKYGSHHNQQHIRGALSTLDDYSWLYNQYIVLNKSAPSIALELGMDSTAIYNRLHAFKIPVDNNYIFWKSRKADCWLTYIENQENINLIREYSFNSTKTKQKSDGYCVETNTIYEFHGDYWHGNPVIHNSDIINVVAKKTMGELYQKTINREEIIRSLGYNLVVMWENEWKLQQKELNDGKS